MTSMNGGTIKFCKAKKLYVFSKNANNDGAW